MSSDNPVFTISHSEFDAVVIFDLDGVVTKTAKVHAAVWKKLFDEYPERRAAREGEQFQPFEIKEDYRNYVNGKPRYEEVKSFLVSRGTELPYGSPEGAPDKEIVCGFGNRKNEIFQEHLKKHGVEVYDPAVNFIRQLRAEHFKTAIVTSSKNCVPVLKAGGLTDLSDAKVDGPDAARLKLAGKPDPDVFLEAARQLNVKPERAVIAEDALAGVQAGSRGRFGCVIGVDRVGHAADLKKNGADIVITDFSQIALHDEAASVRTNSTTLPSALERIEEIFRLAEGKRVAVFLDYDGTLTPIVERPDPAILSDSVRDAVKSLANRCTVAVISGRGLRNVRERVGIIIYAGSHGFDIAGPKGFHMEFQQGTEFLPHLDQAEKALHERLDRIGGVLVERKKFAIAIHFRQVAEEDVGFVEKAVDEVRRQHSKLRKTSGKKIFELQPDIDRDKGRALLWLIEKMDLNRSDVLPVYIGDDTTDEDAFRVLKKDGIGIVVTDVVRSTEARYRLRDPDEVQRFLEVFSKIL